MQIAGEWNGTAESDAEEVKMNGTGLLYTYMIVILSPAVYYHLLRDEESVVNTARYRFLPNKERRIPILYHHCHSDSDATGRGIVL